ncbi:MAG: pyridoxine 5'-phosphate synthase [candidate division Zixibacteria bacterium]|nr:pyridoxine 5'-phosphate synthase [candidate division Zixibacteria bacterium]
MPLLSVNVDMVAATREIRRLSEPDPAQAAVLAELGGADGLALQLRRDRKYVRDRDLYLLKGVTKTRLTIEMPPVDDIITMALEVKPWMVTLVADHADSTNPVSTIGFTVAPVDFGDITARFNAVGVNVGFFVEPDTDQIKAASKADATAVLISCAGYTGARTLVEAQAELDRLDKAVQCAAKAGLEVHCGRGVTYKNVTPLVELGYVDEFVVGHAICCRALLVGFERAVREMIELLRLPSGTH